MGTGGARCGAGRPGYRLKTEHTLKVDIRLWRKMGYLIDGRSFAWQWSRGGEVAGEIGVAVSNDSFRLGKPHGISCGENFPPWRFIQINK